MLKSNAFATFFNALPVLGVDGSLSFVKDFHSNPSLKGAAGHVHAKTGTYAVEEGKQIVLKGQALAGYINTKQNNLLLFQLVVNDVVIHSTSELEEIFQDQGLIAALLWREY